MHPSLTHHVPSCDYHVAHHFAHHFTHHFTHPLPMCSHPCAHDFQVAKRPVHREGRLTLHAGRAVLCDAAGKRLDEETVPRRGTGGLSQEKGVKGAKKPRK
jgi:hypothetical protein